MKTKEGRVTRHIRGFLYLTILSTLSAAVHAAPADGLVFWNPADKDANVGLSNGNLDVSIATILDAAAVRSNRPIYPGEGLYYLEVKNLFLTRNFMSFGIATADASLQGQAVAGTASVTVDGTGIPAIGMAVDYRGEYPVAHFFVDQGNGIEYVKTDFLRDHKGPVYAYLAAWRNASAADGEAQHRLSFGTAEAFTYDPNAAISQTFFDGTFEMNYGWPIDNARPQVTITGGNRITAEGGSLSFSAFANDAESGDVTASTVWFLDDTVIGSGGSVVTSPPAGTYVVRAEAFDGAGQRAFDTIRADVLTNEAQDSDLDGLPYYVEIENGTNPGSPDTDLDGLRDGEEFFWSADPLSSDTDGDGMIDGYEVEHGLDPTADDAALDLDSDTHSNIAEFFANRSASDPDDFPGHGTVLLNSADAHTNIVLQPGALSFSVTPATGIGAVRSDISIASGTGWHYFEGSRHADIGNYGFGVATAAAPLTAAAGTDALSLGIATTGDVSFNGAVVATLVEPEHISTYGIAINYFGPSPVAYILVRPAGGEYQVSAAIPMAGVTGALHIFAYGESQAGVVQQSINAGQNKTDSPFVYSPSYLLHQAGQAGSEFMREGWGVAYVYQPVTEVPLQDEVRFVREPMTSPLVTISRDGTEFGWISAQARTAVRANQQMIGDFRYWEGTLNLPPESASGFGLLNPFGVIDSFCCISADLTSSTPSLIVNSSNSVWRNLVYQGDVTGTSKIFGFAVDYVGPRPTVYMIHEGAVVHTAILDDFITPIVPMMHGGQAPAGPVAVARANFGQEPFQNDARQALIDAGVDVTLFSPGWGAYEQPYHLGDGPLTEPVITWTGATAGLVGQPLNITATATDAEDGDLTTQIQWSNAQTPDLGSGGAYNFTPTALGLHQVTARVSDSAGLEFVRTIGVPVTTSDTVSPIVSVPTPLVVSLATGATVPATDAQIAGFLGAATARDDVDGVVAVSNNAPANLPIGTTNIEFSAADAAGNNGSAISTVTINDTGAPVLTLPANATIGLSTGTTLAATDAAVVAFLTSATANDAVDGNVAVNNDAPASFALGATTVTFTATDAAGNSANGSAELTVTDAGAPTVTAPANISLDLASGSSIPATNATIAAFLSGASAADDVDGSIAVTNDAPASFGSGVTTVTFSATDAAGNSGSATATVTLNDTGAPTVTAPANIALDLASGSAIPATNASIAAFLSGASAADDVDGSIAVTNDAPASFAPGVTTVTFSATDTAGNSDSATATVTVTDTGAPAVTVPAALAVNLASGSTLAATDAAIVDFIAAASATDDVDGALSVTHDAPAAFPIGATTVTFSATDAAGNTTNETSTVTVSDSGAPVVSVPANITIALPTGSSVPLSDAAVAAFLSGAAASDDVDGSIAVTHDAPANFAVGTTTVTFSATDAAGNSDTAAATVTVNDTGAPAITAPANIAVAASTGSSLPASNPSIAAFLTSATATDDVDGGTTVTNDAPASFAIGATSVTFTSTDAAGNIGTASAAVTVNDTGAPTVTTPADLALDLASGASMPATNAAVAAFLSGASAADDVDGSVVVTHDAPASFPVGATVVTFSATDAAGNAGTGAATVTISDTGAPAVTAPADIAVNAATGNSVPASDSAIAAFLSAATANDDVDGSVTVTHDAPASFPIGATVVTFSATDAATNNATSTATVTVSDSGAPAVTAPANLAVSLATGNSVAATDPTIAAFLTGATASDDVDGSTTVTHDAPASFPVGATIVTFSSSDAAGNTGTSTATVTISDTGAPTLSVPAALTINLPTGANIPAADPAIAAFIAAATATDDVDGARPVTNNAPAVFLPGATTVVTFSAADAAGNIATADSSVTVVDTGNPALTLPDNLVIGLASGTQVPVTDAAIAAFLSAATADDNVDGSIAVSNNAPAVFLPATTTIVTFNAVDAAGNAVSDTRTVTVNDTGAPALTVATDIIVDADTASSIPASHPTIAAFLSAATAIDEVDGSVAVTNDAPASFPIGLTAVTFTATDAAGNSTSAISHVAVSDSGSPTVIAPANLVIDLNSGNSVSSGNAAILAFLASANAVDVVDGTIPVSNDAPGLFPMGVTVVTFNATDSAGNAASATATVTVNDAGAPVVTSPAGITIIVIDGNDVPASDAAIAAFLNGSSANDDVDGALSVTNDAPGAFPPGVTTVTFSATDAAGNVGTATSSVAVTVTNVAPIPALTIQQGGATVTTATRDGGIVTIVAAVTDPNVIDTHAYDWVGTDSALTPLAGTASATYTFDPAAVGAGVYSLSLLVTDNGNAPMTGSVSSLVRIIDTVPTLSVTDDSDGDGTLDANEGAGDSDVDRIPNFLDPDGNGQNQIQAGDNGTLIETSTGLVLRLGEAAFTIDAADGLVTLEELETWATAAAAGVPAGMDDDYHYPAGIFSVEITNVAIGGTASVAIQLTEALPANATIREFVTANGWSRFVTDADNLIQSAAGSAGSCPPPGSAEYTDGLTEGDLCLQLTIVDGGSSDTDGVADGTIRMLSGPALHIGPDPTVQAQSSGMNATVFRENDGERVVLDFVISSDSDDVEVHELTVGASGELNESANVSTVALYFDENDDGVADASELLATGSYSSDDGQITFSLGSAQALSNGDNRFLVTYNF